MTTIGNLVGAFEKAKNIENPEQAYENGELEFLEGVKDELENCAEVAQDIILASMTEEKLVKLMLIVQKTVSALSTVNGSTGILLCELSGELQSYTQTVILSTIGALIKDEIL